MAIFNQIKSLASIVNMFAGSDPVKASIVPLSSDGSEVSSLERAFQYFPEQISDSKGANYASRNIPGGSHPLYQFVNGTDRTISFTAVFTSDEDPNPPDLLSALQGGLDFSANTLLSASQISSGTKKHTVPVDNAVIWLRHFLYPVYSNNNVAEPPPVARLYLPNSGIHGTVKGNQLALDSIDCIMNQCDVVYETFYRSGSQRITTVNLSFFETIQTGNNWQFSDGSFFTTNWAFGTRPYNVKSNRVPLSTNEASSLLNRAGTFVGTNF